MEGEERGKGDYLIRRSRLENVQCVSVNFVFALNVDTSYTNNRRHKSSGLRLGMGGYCYRQYSPIKYPGFNKGWTIGGALPRTKVSAGTEAGEVEVSTVLTC